MLNDTQNGKITVFSSRACLFKKFFLQILDKTKFSTPKKYFTVKCSAFDGGIHLKQEKMKDDSDAIIFFFSGLS